MSMFSPAAICIWVSCFLFLLSGTCSSWCPTQFVLQKHGKFEQKSDKFWEYEEQSNSWVQVELPYDLFSCVDDNCTKVGSISNKAKDVEQQREETNDCDNKNIANVLPLRKRLVSLRKMSETSIWVTGQSGSIYERFWNGVQWVIAPHDLPHSAAPANSVFMINHTILALSQAGNLYQMQLSETSQPTWVDFTPTIDLSTSKGAEQTILLKSGVISNDEGRVYFCTKNGLLFELSGTEPPRWLNHGRPPGANVAAIADAATIRPEVIFTISSSGDLYEYDINSKPSWKKHIWRERNAKNTSLKPLTGSVVLRHSGATAHSVSLFLLTKGGCLVERRLNLRKWRWTIHGIPEDEHFLSSTTPVLQDEFNEKFSSLFLTSASGTVWEYRVPRYTGPAQDNQIVGSWVNHMHPPEAKVARGVRGLQFEGGRIIFPLDDGRLGELHLSGLGGSTTGPINHVTVKRKASPPKYLWSILDAPETEGWNAEYCSEEQGPSNCIMGIKDEFSTSRGRKGSTAQQNYLIPGLSATNIPVPSEEYKMPDNNWINRNFRLRVMHEGKSFFLVTDSGFTFEYLNTDNAWLWLRHDHATAMRGAVGDYNGSLFFVDEHGSLLIRERNGNDLKWINCTALKKGRQIIGGPPWDKFAGKTSKVTIDDALFFLSKNGRLLQFTVALRKFKWKDCKNPPTTKIACIVDQEILRENIVFVVGRNGRLYQYNKVTEIWHEHRQSQHLVLSRLPGTAIRPSSSSLVGSLFMLAEDGGLVEYNWDALEGWNWVEHGTPHRSVSLVGSPGPCFQGNQLFLIGSDGNVYLRYFDQTWKWKNCGVPNMHGEDFNRGSEDFCIAEETAGSLEQIEESLNNNYSKCDSKVAPIRPIPFADDSVIFELRDGRLAEMRRIENAGWVWSRTIGTPTSLCISHFWTGLAS